MLEQEKIKSEVISDQDWDEFVENSDYSGFMQSSNWAKVKAEEGWGVMRSAIKEKGKIVALALMLSIDIGGGKKILYSPQGPVFHWHSPKERSLYLDKLIALAGGYAKKENAICWRIEPWALMPYGRNLKKFQKSPVDMQPRHTALIPLIKSEEEILVNFKPKARYNIRLAYKHGLVAEISNSKKAFKTFYSVYRKTVDRKSLDYKEFSYFDSIYHHLARKKQAYIINIKKDDKYIESVLLIKFGERLTYFFGGFDYEYRKYMSPYMCHFEAIKLGKKLGCLFYDLWGIANTENESHPWHSFTEFKLKFDPIKISLTGAYDIVFDPKEYQRLYESDTN